MKKNSAAVALGRLGGKANTEDQRKARAAQASAAAKARWKKARQLNSRKPRKNMRAIVESAAKAVKSVMPDIPVFMERPTRDVIPKVRVTKPRKKGKK